MFEPLGYESLADFVAANEEKGRWYRTALYAQASGLHIRFKERTNNVTEFFMIGDKRLPMKERRDASESLLAKVREGRHCCTGPFIFRVVKTFVRTYRDMFGEDFQAVVQSSARMYCKVMSVAGCERRHL
jgi:hypothetical protein